MWLDHENRFEDFYLNVKKIELLLTILTKF